MQIIVPTDRLTMKFTFNTPVRRCKTIELELGIPNQPFLYKIAMSIDGSNFLRSKLKLAGGGWTKVLLSNLTLLSPSVNAESPDYDVSQDFSRPSHACRVA